MSERRRAPGGWDGDENARGAIDPAGEREECPGRPIAAKARDRAPGDTIGAGTGDAKARETTTRRDEGRFLINEVAFQSNTRARSS